MPLAPIKPILSPRWIMVEKLFMMGLSPYWKEACSSSATILPLFSPALSWNDTCPLPFTPRGALFSQFFQAFNAPFVAGAARFYAFAYPCFFLRVKFVKQAVVFGFYGEFLRFFLAIFGEAAVIGAQRAAV